MLREFRIGTAYCRWGHLIIIKKRTHDGIIVEYSCIDEETQEKYHFTTKIKSTELLNMIRFEGWTLCLPAEERTVKR